MTSPPVAKDRLEIRLVDYLRIESNRFQQMRVAYDHARVNDNYVMRELLESHAELLNLMAQMQQRNEEQNG